MAEVSDVHFVDGVRTPFGRARERGMYGKMRAERRGSELDEHVVDHTFRQSPIRSVGC